VAPAGRWGQNGGMAEQGRSEPAFGSAAAAQPGTVPAPAGPGDDLPRDPGTSAELIRAVEATLHTHLHEHMTALSRQVEQAMSGAGQAIAQRRPRWLRQTPGEARWPVAFVVLIAIGLQFSIPARLAVRPTYLLPALELVLLVLLVLANPRRLVREHPVLRMASLGLVAIATVANVYAAANLVRGLVDGREGNSAAQLLVVGGGIWLTNVIIFALWYWEFDRGGPVARAGARDPYPDFQFPQMQTPDLSHDQWAPTFIDYLYLSFTNAMAFSPTDTLPLSRWAKLLMLSQSIVSLVTVALVIARAVNILR
jgi:uncharacterized membrane protein